MSGIGDQSVWNRGLESGIGDCNVAGGQTTGECVNALDNEVHFAVIRRDLAAAGQHSERDGQIERGSLLRSP